jgi:histidyl-tRNA synthetase
MSTLSTQPYKGTRDYYPEDKFIQNHIFNVWRKVVEGYGYDEYGAPTLEPIDIYAAKSGQELVNEQTYTFTDRGGRNVAIRPEMTPSISRMVAGRRQELAYPARLYSIANFMRYERPQRGREREFWQLNVDIFGVDHIEADAEIITMADDILKQLGGKNDDYVIRINNRQFINYMMVHYLGLDGIQTQQMVKLFDRRGKITQTDFQEQAGLIFEDETDERFQKIEQLLSATALDQLPEELRGADSLQQLEALFEKLKAAGIKSAIFDATLMRGFDYYTGTVFEVFDTHPENNRSLFGGGRYDGLVSAFGVEPISAVGMAPGSTMIENFLTVRGLLPVYQPSAQVAILVIDEAHDAATTVATSLRQAGVAVSVDISRRKLDKQLKAALKRQVSHMMFVGPDDSDTFMLKDVAAEKEERLSIEQIAERLA